MEKMTKEQAVMLSEKIINLYNDNNINPFDAIQHLEIIIKGLGASIIHVVSERAKKAETKINDE